MGFKVQMLACAAALHVQRSSHEAFIDGRQLSTSAPGKTREPDEVKLTLTLDGKQQTAASVLPRAGDAGFYHVSIRGHEGISLRLSSPDPGQPHLIGADLFNGEQPMSFQVVKRLPRGFAILFAGSQHDVLIERPDQAALAQHMPPPRVVDYSKFLRSPMPGALISVAAKVGQSVSPGAELAVIEAMKMRNVLRAEQEGVVKAIPAKVGSVLAADQVIIEFE